MSVGVLLIAALAMAVLGLSIVTVCDPAATAADCDQLKRLIAVDFFGLVALVAVALAVVCLRPVSWRGRTAAVVAVAGFALAFDTVLRHLIAGSPAR